jgi:hypothetical protein
MATSYFNQLLQAIEQLTPEEQSALIIHLQRKVSEVSPERRLVLAEFERRKESGAFENAESLRGMFAHPALDLSFEEIQDLTHQIAKEWEEEIDTFD